MAGAGSPANQRIDKQGNALCHAVNRPCATRRREPCQAGNRAALSDVLRVPQQAGFRMAEGIPFLPPIGGEGVCPFLVADYKEVERPHVSGPLPQVAAPEL